jgi:hypothetical protein
VNQVQGVGVVDQALGAVRNRRRVLGVGALLEEVATQSDLAAVGKVREVAGGACRPVHEVAVLDHRFLSPALEIVANLGFAEVATKHGQFGDLTDVDVVALSIAVAIACELRAFDREGGVARIAQDTVFVVVEPAVDHAQVAAVLGTDAGAIAVGYLRVVEFDVVDGDV